MPASGLADDAPPPANMTKVLDRIWVNESESAFCGFDTYRTLGQYLTGNATKSVRVSLVSQMLGREYIPGRNPQISEIMRRGLGSVMQSVADSATRSALRASNVTVYGTVASAEVYVRVSWGWILLPTVLVVTGLVFLGSTVIVNRGQGLRLWKSSVLAVLFHGLNGVEMGPGGEDGERKDGEDRLATVSQMEERAQIMRVKLRTAMRERGLVLDQE
jgi:hypothetical protein